MSKTTFFAELEALINRHSMENESNTPDFILRNFIAKTLEAFNDATRYRDDWFGGERSILESERSEKWKEAVEKELVELARCPKCFQGALIPGETLPNGTKISKCDNCHHEITLFP